MIKKNKSISFIIPCFNEEKRITSLLDNISTFKKKYDLKYKLSFILVDDGSTDLTNQIIRKNNLFLSQKIKLIDYFQNQGKGYAISKGIENSNDDWIITIDADLSVNFEDALNIFFKNYNKNYYVYFGSRNHNLSKVKKRIHRYIFGFIFNKINKFLLGINISDTQCGFKIYEKSIAKKIFNKLIDNSFAHDIEIVLICKSINIEIKEIPVVWVHKSGSKVNVFIDGFKMLLSILSLKKRFNIKN
ncbi:glycosyltransferase group 2 [alpha proteobacterium HIMB59]|nr:glycosyltransferase group 2 [alpha proteobacterium HIMB59]